MISKIKEPTQQISPIAIKLWRATDIIITFVLLSILIVSYFLKDYYKWGDSVDLLIYGLGIILLISSIIEIIILPVYKQKTWRYEIDEEFIQIKHGGFFKIIHLIIPIEKVYYVNSTQGLLSKRFGLSTITIGTIAYIHEIPGIPAQKANEIRESIAIYSGINLNNKKG